MLYEFHHKDSKRLHYLLGTMHVQDERAFAFVQIALEKMKECNLYIGEIDLGKVDTINFSKAFESEGERHLSNILTEKKLKKYSKSLMKSFGIDLDNYLHLSPMFIQSIISQKVFNTDRPLSLDAYLHQMALSLDLKTGGLETFDEQYHIAQKLDFDTQLKSLDKLCRKPETFRKEILAMIKAYEKADVNYLYKRGKKSLGLNRKILLFERNTNMVSRIIESIISDICFISVGAGHLAGDKGIISGLKKNGFKVKQLV